MNDNVMDIIFTIGKQIQKGYDMIDKAGLDERTKSRILLTWAADILHDVPKDLREEFFKNYEKLHDEVDELCSSSTKDED